MGTSHKSDSWDHYVLTAEWTAPLPGAAYLNPNDTTNWQAICLDLDTPLANLQTDSGIKSGLYGAMLSNLDALGYGYLVPLLNFSSPSSVGCRVVHV